MRTRLGISSSLQTQSADQTRHASLLLLLSCTRLHWRKWCGVCEMAPTPSELMPLHEEPVYARSSTNAKRALPCPKERKEERGKKSRRGRRKEKKKKKKKKRKKKQEKKKKKKKKKKKIRRRKRKKKKKKIDDFVVAFAFAYPHSKKQSSSSLTSYLLDFFVTGFSDWGKRDCSVTKRPPLVIDFFFFFNF